MGAEEDALRAPGDPSGEPVVRAAGGLVVREVEGSGGQVEVAIVHRPRYSDWSLPKGKLDRGEGWEQAALREVCEETGLHCELVRELAPARYRDRKGREKVVRWWLMRALGGRFEPGEEVDELRWVDPREATTLLDYEHDRELVHGLLSSDERPEP